MTDDERNVLIGRAMQEHKQLRQKLGCLAAKADGMLQAVADGVRLLKGDTTGHFKDGALYVAERSHSMAVKECAWPSREDIGAVIADRAETEERLAEVTKQLRDMGMGEYVKAAQ